MGYTPRYAPVLNVGCLPGGIFGVVVAAPALFVTIMGECMDDSGGVTNCPNEGLQIVVILAVVCSGCLAITWATNRFARILDEQGRSTALALLAGFALAACLALALYAGMVLI